MEQVLSGARGHSDWESDQNSLGFLLLDNDDVAADSSHGNPERRQRGEPGIVSLSFDEIFQEGSLNLDELFRASRYSVLDQAYPWECGSDCVGPSWDQPQSPTQKQAEGDCCETQHDVVTADLITFNSGAPSPAHTCTSIQAVDISLPSGTVDTDYPLDALVGQLPLDPMLEQTLSQTLPAQRTSVVEESPDSHWTKEKVTDPLCANLLDLAEESSSRTASYNYETSIETLIPLPFIYDLSSSPPCSVPHPDASDQLSPASFMPSTVQPCDFSRTVLQTTETTIGGLFSGQEHDIPSIRNTIRDDESAVQLLLPSPLGPLASSNPSIQEIKLSRSDSEANSGTLLKSTDGSPESSPLGLNDRCPCEGETTLEMDAIVEKQVQSNGDVLQEAESDLARAVLLSSSASLFEQAAPVEFTSTSSVSCSPHAEFSPDYRTDCANAPASQIDSLCDLTEKSNFSVICDSHSEDIQNPRPLPSEKETPVDTLLALEKEPPLVSPSICLTLEANTESETISPDSKSQTDTFPEIKSKHDSSESANLLEDTGTDQTINTPSVGTLDKITHTFAAVDPHLLSHVQEVASGHTSVDGAARHCQGLNGCTARVNQQPNTRDESEGHCFGACNCTPEKCVNPKDVHVTPDNRQDSNTSVHTHTSDSTPVSEENTLSCAALPVPGNPKAVVMCVQVGEIESKDSELDNVSHPFESVSSSLDSAHLSGADSRLGQVGTAVEQERGEATSRLGQSADVRVDEEIDLPDQLTQADLSQVAEPKETSLRNEPPGGVCPPRETCPPLMEDNAVVPDAPNDAEMALEFCVSSDVIQDGSVSACALPATNPQHEDHSALRTVFQALDQDGDGFVRIEEFMEFATAYGVEQVMATYFVDKRLHLGALVRNQFYCPP